MSLTTIRNDRLTVTISSKGAELQSIRDANGVERLWQGDPAHWAGRAPILFPVAGALRDDCYYLDGRRYTMPKHGFARTVEWRLEGAGEGEAVFVTAEKRDGFPFDYELRARFTLDGASLRVAYEARNTGDGAFYYGLGAHEAYATPGGIEKYTLAFEKPEALVCTALEGSLIRRETFALDAQGGVLPLRYAYFAQDALVFLSLESRAVTLRGADGRTIRVAYPGHDVLLLWTKPGAEFLCIEPWLNAPDFVDSDMQIERKPGCVRLAPGERATRAHTITVG